MKACHIKVNEIEFAVDYQFSPEEREGEYVKWPAVIELDSVEHCSEDITELLAEWVLDQIKDELLEDSVRERAYG